MKKSMSTLAAAAAALTTGALFVGGNFASASSPEQAATASTTAAATPAGANCVNHVKPTIVMVHGAFADSSSWNGEIKVLTGAGYPVVAVANPLRGLASDTAYLDGVLKTVTGPVVLVGHSYAGMVISQSAAKDANVKALVYVAALIPEKGDSANSLIGKYPGSQLVPANFDLRTEPGATDVYIKQNKFEQVYAGGLSKTAITLAAATQRPIAASAFSDTATAAAPFSVPKWMVVALDDHAVPTKLQFVMANRVHAHVTQTHSGHDVPAAQPEVVASVVLQAAANVS